jgi:hypothetical protein
MECFMLITSIVAVIVAIIAMFIAVHAAQMTTKIQFLLNCYSECVEIGRLPNGSPLYTPRLNALLDRIVVFGDDFNDFVKQYRIPNQTTLSLSNLDKLFLDTITKYQKYIKV